MHWKKIDLVLSEERDPAITTLDLKRKLQVVWGI